MLNICKVFGVGTINVPRMLVF